MPATVTVKYLGNPQTEASLRLRLEELLKNYAGTWKVIVVGSQENAIWEVIVTGPDNRSQWVYKKFHRQRGEQTIEAILTEVRRIAQYSRTERKATA